MTATRYLVLCIALVGTARTFAQSQISVLGGHARGDSFGQTVAVVGDVTGDAVPDFVIGATAAMGGMTGYPGSSVRVFSGVDASEIYTIVSKPWAGFGEAIAGLGDIDGDGRADFVVGAPANAVYTDFARVHSGRTGGYLFGWSGKVSDSSWDDFGRAVSGVGDVDGDDVTDILVGAPGAFGPFTGSEGYVKVFSGADGTLIREIAGDAYYDGFGSSLVDVRDVDGDGRGDFVVGAPGHDAGGTDAGRITLFSGADASVLMTRDGAPGDRFGAVAAACGDIDRDGTDDLIVGAWGTGVASVLSGEDLSLLHVLPGPIGVTTVIRVAGAGDLNADGHADLLVSKPNSTYAKRGGVVAAYSGHGGEVLFTVYGDESTAAGFGTGIAGVGDLDGDGYDDLAVGVPRSSFAMERGQVQILSGRCLGSTLSYGSGCPGTGGFTPWLAVDGCPTPQSLVHLRVEGGLGGATAHVSFGLDQTALPLPNGCTILVSSLVGPAVILPLSPGGPGGGAVTVPVVVPPSLPLGTHLALQAFLPDAGAAGGFSSTQAVRLDFQ